MKSSTALKLRSGAQHPRITSKAFNGTPPFGKIRTAIASLEGKQEEAPQAAKFVQIATAGSGEDIALFALDSDGIVWGLYPGPYPDGWQMHTQKRNRRQRWQVIT